MGDNVGLRCPLMAAGWEVSKWLVTDGDVVQTRQALLKLSDPSAKRADHTIMSNTDGKVVDMLVETGDRTTAGQLLVVIEKCSHEVMFHGLCAACGADVTELPKATEGRRDLTAMVNSPEDTHSEFETATEPQELPSIKLVPSRPEIRVTLGEASEMDESRSERLYAERRAILVLDLDRTLVHASCDFRAGRAPEVHKFYIETSSAGRLSLKTSYYVRMRPHLEQFLAEMCTLFELYIYTAGSRSYAKEVAQIIDPTGKYFNKGDRILSADESQDRNAKQLEHLFPIDQSMVVILDDRADVWGDCSSLIRIHPFIFFTSEEANVIPKDQLEKQQKDAVKSLTRMEDQLSDEVDTRQTSLEEAQEASEKVYKRIVAESSESVLKASSASAQQLLSGSWSAPKKPSEDCGATSASGKESAPSLDRETAFSNHNVASPSSEGMTDASQGLETNREKRESDTTPANLPYRPSAEKDNHLLPISAVLKKAHKLFFNAIDEGSTLSVEMQWILAKCRSEVLRNCVLLFSHVVPTQNRGEGSVFWQLALCFGAQCCDEWQDNVTHVVAGSSKTQKVAHARDNSNAYIVRLEWLVDSIINYYRMPERMYVISSQEQVCFRPDVYLRLLAQLHRSYVQGLELEDWQWIDVYGENSKAIQALKNSNIKCVNREAARQAAAALSATSVLKRRNGESMEQQRNSKRARLTILEDEEFMTDSHNEEDFDVDGEYDDDDDNAEVGGYGGHDSDSSNDQESSSDSDAEDDDSDDDDQDDLELESILESSVV